MKFLKSNNLRYRNRNQIDERKNIKEKVREVGAENNQQVEKRFSAMEAQLPQDKKNEENQYKMEIIHYLGSKVSAVPTNPNYFTNQPDITEHMRGVLLNWLIDVHLKYKLQAQTLFLTVHIIDTFLEQQTVPRTELQLVGMTALWIAAKYQETYQVPKITNLVFICDSTYTKEQILHMETRIIDTIGFSMLTTTSLHYFKCLNEMVQLDSKDYCFCLYLLEICLMELSFRKYHPKLIASSVVFFIHKLRRKDVCWTPELEHIFKCCESELRPCARDICTAWHQAVEINTMPSLKMKYSSTSMMEVGKIRIMEVNRK